MNKTQLNPRSLCLSKYNSSRYSLLFMLALTAVNIVMALTGSFTYFLFSASIPYTLVMEGIYMTGGLPEEYYADLPAGTEFFDTSVLIVLTVIAVVVIGVYLLCFFMSAKNRTGWLVAATVIFSLDTLFMLAYYGITADGIVDILMHALMIYYLINGVVNGFKLKKLPEYDDDDDDVVIPEVPVSTTTEVPSIEVAEEAKPTQEVTSEEKEAPAEDSTNE